VEEIIRQQIEVLRESMVVIQQRSAMQYDGMIFAFSVREDVDKQRNIGFGPLRLSGGQRDIPAYASTRQA
jgi:hypothetical protein